jgi:predicted signal transduction protein with EAL and GGDEF domain
MIIPIWLTLGVAALVMIFGVYRIVLGFRSDEEDQRAKARKGLYAMGRRTHFLIGIVYLLLGGGLVATSFGWNPFGRSVAAQEDAAPSDGILLEKKPKAP